MLCRSAACGALSTSVWLQPLMEAGLDSLGAVDLRSSLAAAFGLELPATVIFDYPNAVALAEWLQSQLVSTVRPSRSQHALLACCCPQQSHDDYLQALCIFILDQWCPQSSSMHVAHRARACMYQGFHEQYAKMTLHQAGVTLT